MSTSVSWAVRIRRVVLPLVCVVSAAAAVAAQFAPSHLIDIRSASTGQLVSVLLLLALPAATLAALFTERRFRRPQARAAVIQPAPLVVPNCAPSFSTAASTPASNTPSGKEAAPAPAPAPAPIPRQHPPAPRPRISVVIETKPAHQVYTLTASPRGVRAA